MSNVSGQGTVCNLPNYSGELFTADMINTPLLSMIGGLTGGAMTNNFEFTQGARENITSLPHQLMLKYFLSYLFPNIL